MVKITDGRRGSQGVVYQKADGKYDDPGAGTIVGIPRCYAEKSSEINTGIQSSACRISGPKTRISEKAGGQWSLGPGHGLSPS